MNYKLLFRENKTKQTPPLRSTNDAYVSEVKKIQKQLQISRGEQMKVNRK